MITAPTCAAACQALVNAQRMSARAAVTGDVDRLKLAVLHAPLVGAVRTPKQVRSVVDGMLAAQTQSLPQYGFRSGVSGRKTSASA